ncbi:MAG: xanthine dehydrogenase family protein molybdopterin-binding subunit [Clostridiales Family XIII bacterium]|jgi:carbon-monoxide dehydrogenase large subunit|nr:xanthine dehydrogenase family protein molybdopterin-binding subunit [Clostridiales Family XIII bacterium]
MSQKNHIGESVTHIDAWDKVTGSAVYCGDMSFLHQLYGAVYRSPFSHAKIITIDLAEVWKTPGVKAVVTGEDFPRLYGQYVVDQPFLAFGKVRFKGEPVVAIAADTPESAAEAVKKVHAVFEELPAVLDVYEAVAEGAPLVHDDWSKYSVADFIRPEPGTNICDHFQLSKGDMDAGFREADVIDEGEFSTPMIQHVTIETHCAIAQCLNDGTVNVWSPCQSPFAMRDQLAAALKLPLRKVRVIASSIGGAFGGKNEMRVEPIVIALAMKVPGKHVKLVFTREEEFLSSVVRGESSVKVKLGAKNDGTLTAVKVETYLDTGAYATTGPRVNFIAGFASSGPYVVPNIKVDGYCVSTTRQIGSSFRGFGVSEIAWAYESQMDCLAKRLKMDPLDLRMKNAVEDGSISATGERLFSVSAKQCLQAVADAIDWKNRDPVITPEGKIRTKGIATFMKPTGTPSNSSAVVRLNDDGTVNVMIGGMEMGQSMTTVIAQMVAHELGISMDSVEMTPVDTEYCPFEKHSSASRLTFHIGNAAVRAAKDVMEQLRRLAAIAWNVDPRAIKAGRGELTGPGGQSVTLPELRKASILRDQDPVIGKGAYSTSDIYVPLDPVTRQSARPMIYWMWGAQAVEIEVDPETGKIQVLKVAAAHDVGRAINPVACYQQIEGAVSMGVGHALIEEMIFDGGDILNANMVDYKVPTIADIPLETQVILIENGHPEGPYGAKGIGEPGIIPTVPAIGNALCEAIGERIHRLPMKPEKVLEALKKRSEHCHAPTI